MIVLCGVHSYRLKSQDTVYGNFHRNKPHGEGLARYCDGSSYDGDFKEGMRHGKGTLEDNKGVRSTGTWVSDKRDGEFEVNFRTIPFFLCKVFVFVFVFFVYSFFCEPK